MNKENEFVVWSNRFDDVEKHKDYLQEEYSDYTDEQLYEIVYEDLSMQINDERANLNIPTDGQILIVADLGLWNGRKPGYKI